jgi:hypothetical protein
MPRQQRKDHAREELMMSLTFSASSGCARTEHVRGSLHSFSTRDPRVLGGHHIHYYITVRNPFIVIIACSLSRIRMLNGKSMIQKVLYISSLWKSSASPSVKTRVKFMSMRYALRVLAMQLNFQCKIHNPSSNDHDAKESTKAAGMDCTGGNAIWK